MKKVLFVFCFLFLISGCATLNGSVAFRYVPSLNTGQQSTAALGVEKFIDNRPGGDKDATESISDVDEKITSKILEDFRSSQLFSAIDFPVRYEKDNLIMKGEIKRFYWKASANPIMYIPVYDLFFAILGMPIYHIKAIVELNVKMIDAKSNIILSEYDKISSKGVWVFLYSETVGESGAELAEAFRDVVKQIKDGISNDIETGKIKLSYKN